LRHSLKGKRLGLKAVKTYCVTDEQLSPALLADIISFEKDLDRAGYRAVNPALIGKWYS
jgi:hypothetical protein